MLFCNNCKTYLVGAVSATGGFLFGYETGVISGIFIMNGFLTQMNINITDYADSAEINRVNAVTGGVVGILLVGCFLGSLIGGQTSDRLSRKYSISVFAFIFTIGVALQTASFELIQFFIGRFITGLSVGALSMIIPVYHSEIAETKFRGRIVTLQQLAVTIGIAISFWMNAILYNPVDLTSQLWRYSLGVQMIPSLMLTIGILLCPFSPRWLISRDHVDEAQTILRKIRQGSDDEIKEEINRIIKEVVYLRENEIDSYRHLFRRPFLRPLLLGIGIHVLQQLTGINIVVYYAPRILVPDWYRFLAIFEDSYTQIFIFTGIFGTINVLFTILTLFFIDKIGRRRLLILGATIMCISMLSVSTIRINVLNNGTDDYDGYINSAQFRIIATLIGIFVIGFCISWGPIPWIYCTEIFPLTMRARATSLTTATNWVTNSAISFLVPIGLPAIGSGVFIIFAILCGIMVFIIFSLYPETKDKHLERDITSDRTNNYSTFSEQGRESINPT